MDEDEYYDAIVVLDNPITIRVEEDDNREIFGLLYSTKEARYYKTWCMLLELYISYLAGCERAQKNGAVLEPDRMINKMGCPITLTSRMKNLTYQLMKDKMTGYRLVEFNKPLVSFSDECEDRFITSTDILSRYGIETNRIITAVEYGIEEDVE